MRRTTLTPRALDSLPRITADAITTVDEDALHVPDMPHRGTRTGWLDPLGLPYVTVLRNAVFYPQPSLAPPDEVHHDALPEGLTAKDLGLLVTADDQLLPDSFGKSWAVPGVVSCAAGQWTAHLPHKVSRLRGTWLYGELFYNHFGHTLTDMPARLWPFEAGLFEPGQIKGVVGQGLMGAGARGKQFPGYAQQVLGGLGLRPKQVHFADRPVRIDRLIVPRRIAPYGALWNPVYARMMRGVGDRLVAAAGISEHDRPTRLWLSRARLKDDARGGPGLAALDRLMERQGFAVVHPQELPFAEQVALMRGATHIAGPIGSQLHLCVFCRQPGVRILSVGPSYFKVPINNRFLRDLGGEETYFDVPGERPPGPRQKARWNFDPALEDSFAAHVADWARAS